MSVQSKQKTAQKMASNRAFPQRLALGRRLRGLSQQEKRALRAVLESLILKHEAQRWNSRP
ncbi:MAG: hypothetical protein ACRD1E_00740 [Terriglobales bacterium]